MRKLITVGLMVALVSLATVAAVVEPPYKIITAQGATTFIEIQNNTTGFVTTFVIFFTSGVNVTHAIAYGPSGAPAKESIEGRGTGWRVTLQGKGLGPGGFLRIAFTGDAGIRRVLGQ